MKASITEAYHRKFSKGPRARYSAEVCFKKAKEVIRSNNVRALYYLRTAELLLPTIAVDREFIRDAIEQAYHLVPNIYNQGGNRGDEYSHVLAMIDGISTAHQAAKFDEITNTNVIKIALQELHKQRNFQISMVYGEIRAGLTIKQLGKAAIRLRIGASFLALLTMLVHTQVEPQNSFEVAHMKRMVIHAKSSIPEDAVTADYFLSAVTAELDGGLDEAKQAYKAISRTNSKDMDQWILQEEAKRRLDVLMVCGEIKAGLTIKQLGKTAIRLRIGASSLALSTMLEHTQVEPQNSFEVVHMKRMVIHAKSSIPEDEITADYFDLDEAKQAYKAISRTNSKDMDQWILQEKAKRRLDVLPVPDATTASTSAAAFAVEPPAAILAIPSDSPSSLT